MAFCPQCGAQTSGGAFCDQCGAALSAGRNNEADSNSNPYAVGAGSVQGGYEYFEGADAGEPIPGFGEAIKRCFTKYATFRGRASRSEYWFWILFTFLLGFVLNIFTSAATIIDPRFGQVARVGVSLVNLGLALPGISALIRRFHDTGRSGWYWWLGFLGGILFYGALILGILSNEIGINNSGIYLDINKSIIVVVGAVGVAFLLWALILTVLPSQKGTNQYGPQPRPKYWR